MEWASQEDLSAARRKGSATEAAYAVFQETGKIGGKAATMESAAELEEKRRAAQTAITEAENRSIEAAGQRLAAEQAISREKIAGVERSIAGAKEELAVRKQAIDAEKQRFMGIQERIAAMNAQEQVAFKQQVQAIQKREAAGETQTAEEFKFTQQWAELPEFKAIKEAQAEKRSRGIVSELDLGRESRKRITDIDQGALSTPESGFRNKTTEAVNVMVKQQQEVKVKLEADENAIVRKIASEVRRLQSEQNERIAAKLREEWDRNDNAAGTAAMARGGQTTGANGL
jgi:hypothetical protein